MNVLGLIFSNPFVAFLILIAVVVFVHELGHYLVGRALGIDVEEFAIGFGPTAVKFKRGLTEYKICWLPLGGYVRFYGAELGQEIPPEKREKAILTAKLYKRALVSIAGPFANFLLSLFIMSVLSGVGMPQPSTVVAVLPDGAAASAGVQDGDKIIAIDDKKIRTWSELNQIISASANQPLRMVVVRDDRTVDLQITPKVDETEDPFGEKQKVGRIGVTPVLATPRVVVADDSQLAKAGVLSGDKIVSINDEPVHFFYQITEKLSREGKYKIALERPRQQNISELASALKNERRHPLEAQNLTLDAELSHGVLDNEIVSTDLVVGQWSELSSGDKLVAAQNALQKCDLNIGDAITALNGKLTKSSVQFAAQLRQMQSLAHQTNDTQISLNLKTIGWNGQRKSLACNIPLRNGYDELNREKLLLDFPLSFLTAGATAENVIVKSDSVFEAVQDGFDRTLEQATTIFKGIQKLVSGKVPLSNLGGPIAIAQVAGDAAQGGLLVFVLTISWMSVNIGMFNLLPLPALDGGHLLMHGVEAAYGKPLPMRVQEMVQRIGIAVILLLFVLVFYNDILRLFRS